MKKLLNPSQSIILSTTYCTSLTRQIFVSFSISFCAAEKADYTRINIYYLISLKYRVSLCIYTLYIYIVYIHYIYICIYVCIIYMSPNCKNLLMTPQQRRDQDVYKQSQIYLDDDAQCTIFLSSSIYRVLFSRFGHDVRFVIFKQKKQLNFNLYDIE